MNHIDKIIVIILTFLSLSSCNGQTIEDLHQGRLENMRIILEAGNTNDTLKFREALNENFFRDYYRIENTTKRLYYLLTKYHHNNIDSIEWNTDGVVDPYTNQIEYKSYIFNGFDSTTGYQSAVLIFRYWNFPFTTLAGIELDFEVDSDYRGKLRIEGKLPEIDDLVEWSNNAIQNRKSK